MILDVTPAIRVLMKTYGKHIKLQLYRVDFDLLVDTNLAYKYLVSLVEAAKMRVLGEPHVYDIKKQLELQGEIPDEFEPEGVTGFVVLSTSHATIHTWPHRGYAVIDLFSCADFDSSTVEVLTKNFFKTEKLIVSDLSYSLELPDFVAKENKNG